MNTEPTKTCTKCHETKPLPAFSKNKNSPDGHMTFCKACKSAYDKTRYPEIGRKKTAQAMAWYCGNTERKRDYDAERRAAGGVRTRSVICEGCSLEKMVRPGERFCSITCRGLGRRQAVVTYGGLHQRLADELGPADNHRCVDCLRRAEHWSYNHEDPDELLGAPEGGGEGMPYSLDSSFYELRCVSCHARFDRSRWDVAA